MVDGSSACSLTIDIVSRRSHAAQSFSECQQGEASLPQAWPVKVRKVSGKV